VRMRGSQEMLSSCVLSRHHCSSGHIKRRTHAHTQSNMQARARWTREDERDGPIATHTLPLHTSVLSSEAPIAHSSRQATQTQHTCHGEGGLGGGASWGRGAELHLACAGALRGHGGLGVQALVHHHHGVCRRSARRGRSISARYFEMRAYVMASNCSSPARAHTQASTQANTFPGKHAQMAAARKGERAAITHHLTQSHTAQKRAHLDV